MHLCPSRQPDAHPALKPIGLSYYSKHPSFWLPAQHFHLPTSQIHLVIISSNLLRAFCPVHNPNFPNSLTSPLIADTNSHFPIHHNPPNFLNIPYSLYPFPILSSWETIQWVDLKFFLNDFQSLQKEKRRREMSFQKMWKKPGDATRLKVVIGVIHTLKALCWGGYECSYEPCVFLSGQWVLAPWADRTSEAKSTSCWEKLKTG